MCDIKLTPAPSTNLRSGISGIAELRKSAGLNRDFQITQEDFFVSGHRQFTAPTTDLQPGGKRSVGKAGFGVRRALLLTISSRDWGTTISVSPHLVVIERFLTEQ